MRSTILVGTGLAGAGVLMASLALANPPSRPATPKKAASTASASADSAPAPEVKGQAEALFETGAAAYNQGRYYEAVDIFLEVNRLFPNPALSFNIAKSY